METYKGNRMCPISIKGMPLFNEYYHEKDLDEVLQFEPREDDVFLVTYPKCGTTWMQYILWEIFHRGEEPPKKINDVMLKEMPFLEMTGPSVLYNHPEPRVFKTHMPWHFIPQSPKAKYIIVVRNPFDCCVSYYHHERDVERIQDLTFEEYFEAFLDGLVPYGNFFDNVLSYYPHKDEDNVLWVNFEDMKKDVKSIILEVAEFLGPDHRAALKDDSVLRNIIKYVDFDYMKQNLALVLPKQPFDTREEFLSNMETWENMSEVKFIREGKIGNHKTFLTEKYKNKLVALMNEKLKGTAMENYWQEYVD